MKIGSVHFSFFLYKTKINKHGLAPIYCRLIQNDKEKFISTSIRVPPENFIKATSSIEGFDESLNEVLASFKIKLQRILLSIYNNDEQASLQEIVSLLKGESRSKISLGFLDACEQHNIMIKKLIGKEYSIRTYEKYHLIYRQVEQFFKHAYKVQDVSLKDIGIKHLVEFEEYLLIERKLKQVTANKSIQRLKKIIKFAMGHEWLDKNPWLLHQTKSVHIEIKYLSSVELNKILYSTIKNDKIKRAKDCFVFQCFTGLGYSELKSLTKEHIEEKDGLLWLHLIRHKTKRKIIVPILPPARRILESYDFVLPVISNQNYNKHLKILAKIISTETNITSHLARKTFTTTVLLENNIPLKVASRLLAHTTTKTTEKHYAEINSGLLKEHIEKLSKKYK